MNQSIEYPETLVPGHILLVDDDDFMVDLIGDMLHDLGVKRVTSASDGSRGLAALAGASPDIVICDINMPNTDGFQMMEMMAKERSGCGFILVSGLDSRFMNSAALMARFHHLNILGTLQKPVEREALATLIKKWRPQTSSY